VNAPSPASWTFEPLFLALAVAAALLYFRARPRHRPGRGRVTAFVVGLVLVAVPLNSPFETISSHYWLLAHLLQNAMIADWAPPLLIAGLTPAMRSAVAARGGRLFALVTQPVFAIGFWLCAWYATHLPLFYDWALRAGWPLNIEHGILLTAGLLFWWPLLEPQPRRLSTIGTICYLLVAFVASPWLSLALIFAPPVYSFYEQAPRLLGLSAAKDQNYAGILMNAELTMVFFVLLAYHLLQLLAEEERMQLEREGRAPTGGDA
jgi:cytochrome c oxidase assembly factor CtaG